MILPSIAACLLSAPFWEVSFVTAFDYDPYASVKETFFIIFGDSWLYLWPIVLVSILQAVSASLVMSAIDKHFRTGKLTLRSPTRLLNYSIGPLAVGIAVMSVVSIIWRFVLFGLVSLVQVTSGAIGLNAGATLAIICVLALALFVVHVLIITPVLYWAPIMFIYGYRLRDAAALSFKLISGKRLFMGLLLPMLPCVGIEMLIGFLKVHTAISCAVGGAVFLFTNIYIVVYVILSFYRISDLDRRDISITQRFPLPEIKPAASQAEKQLQKQAGETDVTQSDGEKSRVKKSNTKTDKKSNAVTPPKRSETTRSGAAKRTKTDENTTESKSRASRKTAAKKNSDESVGINAASKSMDGGENVV